MSLNEIDRDGPTGDHHEGNTEVPLRPWQKSRRAYEAEGFGLAEDHPLAKEGYAASKAMHIARAELLSGAPNSTLCARDPVAQALRSRKVTAEKKEKYRRSATVFKTVGERIDLELDHRTVVIRAVADGLPVPQHVLDEYPDLPLCPG